MDGTLQSRVRACVNDSCTQDEAVRGYEEVRAARAHTRVCGHHQSVLGHGAASAPLACSFCLH